MKDAFGRELKVGDKVLYATTPLGDKGFMVAELVNFRKIKYQTEEIDVLPLKAVGRNNEIKDPNKTRIVYAQNCVRLDSEELLH